MPPQNTHTSTFTVFVQGQALPIDRQLLLQQVSTLGHILGPPPATPTAEQVRLLKGVWHMLHDILDIAETAAHRTAIH